METKEYIKDAVGLQYRMLGSGKEATVIGTNVCYIDFTDEGRVYYCDGKSFPACIVTSILLVHSTNT